MPISEEAKANKPKRPLNAYFKFKMDRLAQLKDTENKVAIVQKEWESLSEKERQKLNDAYKPTLLTWHSDMDKWKGKYKVTDEDLKRSSKAAKSASKGKGQKSKGDQKIIATNDRSKPKEAPKSIDAKSKSKPKGTK